MIIESDVSGGPVKQFQLGVTSTPQSLSNLLNISPSRGVQLKSVKANTAIIYIGAVDVTASNGYGLDPGEAIFLKLSDLTKLFVVSPSNQTLYGLIY